MSLFDYYYYYYYYYYGVFATIVTLKEELMRSRASNV